MFNWLKQGYANDSFDHVKQLYCVRGIGSGIHILCTDVSHVTAIMANIRFLANFLHKLHLFRDKIFVAERNAIIIASRRYCICCCRSKQIFVSTENIAAAVNSSCKMLHHLPWKEISPKKLRLYVTLGSLKRH
jgi:hypothetical protein